MLKLKLQHFSHLMQRADSLEKTPDAGKDWRQKEKMRWLDIITDLMDMNLSKLQEIVEDRGDWRTVVHGVAKTQFSDWTTAVWLQSPRS